MNFSENHWQQVLSDLRVRDDSIRTAAVGRISHLTVPPSESICAEAIELLVFSSPEIQRDVKRAFANGLSKHCLKLVADMLEHSPQHGEVLLTSIQNVASHASIIFPQLVRFFRQSPDAAARSACAAVLRFVDVPEAKEVVEAHQAAQRALFAQRRAEERERERKLNEAAQDPDGVIARLPWPATLLSGDEASRLVLNTTHHTFIVPIILGEVINVIQLLEAGLPSTADVEAILADAATMDTEVILRDRIAQLSLPGTAALDWSVIKEQRHLNSNRDGNGKTLRQVCLVYLPIEHSWQVPAFLGFGNFNDCLAPAEHVALLKRWHELYGAEVVACAGNTLECRVSRPPAYKEAALDLARELCAYNPAAEDPGSFAPFLLHSKFWFFWWK